jgi:6-phosphogluconolactonase (cycloisomerase 2 family)
LGVYDPLDPVSLNEPAEDYRVGMKDTIRGMRFLQDGEYVVAAGQEGGGVEVYRISGKRGDTWALEAALREGLERGIKHAIWL